MKDNDNNVEEQKDFSKWRQHFRLKVLKAKYSLPLFTKNKQDTQKSTQAVYFYTYSVSL